MSVCSTAVGLLATVAAVHITITIVLGGLVAFVLHIRRRSKIIKHQRQIAKTTEALVAAGRTISLSDPRSSDHKKDEPEEIGELTLESSGRVEGVAREKETSEEIEKEDMLRENFINPWAGRIKVSPDHDDSEVVLRRKPDPLRRIGTPITQTGLPLVHTASPLVRTTSPIDEMRRKARASVISIASNLSSRFRKSVDLNEEEVAKLVSMSTLIDSSDSNSEEGILEISGDDKVDDRDINVADDFINTSNAGEERTLAGSTVQLKIDFPDWAVSESNC